jgi:hypothetical protein
MNHVTHHLLKIKNSLPAAVLVGLTIFVFQPTVIYLSNINQFQFSFFNVLEIYTAIFFVCVLITSAISLFINKKINNLFIVFLLAISVSLWFQGNILLRDYGALDGTLINWSAFSKWSYLDPIIWVVIISLFLFNWTVINNNKGVIVLTVLLLNGISVVQAWYQAPNAFVKASVNSNRTVPSEMYVFSEKFNIIHILADHFQSDTFIELLEENKWESQFDGFTLYREHLGAPKTTFAYPQIFSGKHYEWNQSPEDYYAAGLGVNSFINPLLKKGYSVNKFTYMQMPAVENTNIYDISHIGRSVHDINVFESLLLLDLSLFRISPQPIKEIIYQQSNFLFSQIYKPSRGGQVKKTIDFYRDYIQKVKVENNVPAYYFFGLHPPHPPYIVESTGNYSDYPLVASKENYKAQAKLTLELIIEMLNSFKEKGIYDNSLIIFQSDHGSEFPPVKESKELSLPGNRAPAIFAVKLPNNKNKSISYSDLETSHLDVSATILESIGIPSFGDGQSVVSSDFIPATRYYIGNTLKYYKINGSIFSPFSWESLEAKKVIIKISAYEIGQEIIFGALGNAHQFQTKGWSSGGNGITWTASNTAELELKIKPNQGQMVMQLNLMPFLIPGKLDTQHVSLFVNDKFIKEWALSDLKFQKIQADLGELETEIVNIKFVLPNATVPRELGFSPDVRKLGLAVAKLIICSARLCNE